MFRKDRKEQARLWLLCWALLNAVVALFTVCSFCIDRNRFGFPERSVCYLALCALLSALPHLLRPLIGFDSLACAQLPSGAKFLLLGGHHQRSVPCLVSFLLSYYFSLAGHFWWLLLGFTWYLSAARKWVEEEIGKRSLFLHLMAWGMPAVLAAVALYAQWVDASELTGLCSVGNLDPLALLWLWLLPRLGLTMSGVFLLLAGFSSMCKERNSFRRRGTDTSRLEKFLLKMGSFALIYVLTALLGSLCDLHYLSVLARWYPNTVDCKAHGGVFSGQCIRPEQPEPELYVLGQTMALVVGLVTGLWMFSPKTLTSWKKAVLCCWPAPPKSTNIVPAHAPRAASTASGGQSQQATAMVPTQSGTPYPFAAAHCQSRPCSLPPSQRPLLYSSCVPPPLDPPSLPPPPPTAVPSSVAAALFNNFCGSSGSLQQQPHHYIPLSVMTTAQGSTGNNGNGTTRNGGFENLFHQAGL